jgi:hypothetical protein
MSQVLFILFGAGFTVAVSGASGSLLLRRLRVSLYREEAVLFGFLGGAALLSLLAFLLSVLHQARPAVFAVVGAAILGAALYERRTRPERKALPPLPRRWKFLFAAVFAVFFFVYFVNAMAPEISPDGSGYHLGNVVRIARRYGFVWDYHSMYSYLSQGMEMLFLVAFSFGRHSAAALVHFAFQAVLPLLIVCYGRRFGFARSAVLAAILVYACPVAGRDGSSAYNDLAVAAILFAVFYLLQIWDANQEPHAVILIGLLCGFGFGVKYTALLSLPYAAGFVWWRAKCGNRWSQIAILTAAAAVTIVPWMLRNWFWLGNPLSPFANSWFPNPYYHPGMERMYLADLFHYEGLRHGWQIPWEVMVRGRVTGGVLGPLFLLSPLALVALGRMEGRRLMAAALVFGVPAYFNAGTRFLIPSLPFVSLAMGLALARFPVGLAVVAVIHAAAGWPAILSRYCDPTAWRLRSIPVTAALRIQPEDRFLTEHLKGYDIKAALETLVPRRAKILSLDSWPEAYLDRDIVVAYESSLGNLAFDLLAVPLDRKIQPGERESFRFLPVTTSAVRVLQTAPGPGYWTVAELRVFSRGRELPRSDSWRIRAEPNGWDVPLAFDNSYVTRWSSWQAMRPGMHVDVSFGAPELVDELVLESTPSPESKIEVHVQDEQGQWIPVTNTSMKTPLDVPSGLRRGATRELKAHGISYLLVGDSDFYADDMHKNSAFWSVTELRRWENTRLYLIN